MRPKFSKLKTLNNKIQYRSNDIARPFFHQVKCKQPAVHAALVVLLPSCYPLVTLRKDSQYYQYYAIHTDSWSFNSNDSNDNNIETQGSQSITISSSCFNNYAGGRPSVTGRGHSRVNAEGHIRGLIAALQITIAIINNTNNSNNSDEMMTRQQCIGMPYGLRK
jgi:hypothetical protein